MKKVGEGIREIRELIGNASGCSGHLGSMNSTEVEQLKQLLRELEAAATNIPTRIREELVCCEQYKQLAYIRKLSGFKGVEPLSRELRRHGDGICYWGEAAARIVEGEVL